MSMIRQMRDLLGTRLYDPAWFRDRYGRDLRDLELTEYLLDKINTGEISISPFFDAKHYAIASPDLDFTEICAPWHFARCGYAEQRSPHWLITADDMAGLMRQFEEKWSLSLFIDLCGDRITEVSRYFVKADYLAYNQDIATGDVSPLRHFLATGIYENRQWNPWISLDWYRNEYALTALEPTEALSDLLRTGLQEGRSPSRRFDTRWYVEAYPQAAAGPNPFYYFLNEGLATGHQPNAEAATAEAAASSEPDLAEGALAADYDSAKQRLWALRRHRIENFAEHTISYVPNEPVSADAIRRVALPRAEYPEVSIVITAFNQAQLLYDCLRSIAKARSTTSYEVILVNDASTEALIADFASIANLVYVENETNLGFLRSNNVGFSEIRAPYTLLLNSDTQVGDGWLDALVANMEDRRVGAVGPKLVYPNGRLQEAGVSLDIEGNGHMVGLFDDPDAVEYRYRREVDYCSGACLLVRSEVLLERGGLDESFAPAYCEDLDLCLSLRAVGFHIIYEPRAIVIHALSASYGSSGNFRKSLLSAKNQQRIATIHGEAIAKSARARVLAFYLPQFHPIAENDLWWGKGFTEWKNVSSARKLFPEHYQPHIPADLGFYDLRLPETLNAQAALGRRYGIDGFCFYYYNFGGRRVLERPIEMLLANRSIDMEFCLCWANEPWSRRWDGSENDVLIAQSHTPADNATVLSDAMRHFRDPRYIRIDGKPLFLVYRISLFDDFAETARAWRAQARENGEPGLYLVAVESMEISTNTKPPQHYGVDAFVTFAPQGGFSAAGDVPGLTPEFEGSAGSYMGTVENLAVLNGRPGKRFPCVFPSWDNTPRRGHGSTFFVGSTPERFRAHAENMLLKCRDFLVGDERLMFINAWNEWAEGTHMEPDQRYGHRWLEALAAARAAVAV